MPQPGRDPAQVVALLDGRATWHQLSVHCTQHAVRRTLDQGRLARSRRGLYVLPDLPDARAAAAGAGGVLSHLSAAVELGMGVLVRPSTVDVTVPRHAPRLKAPGLRLHHVDLGPEVRSRTTTPLRTVLDCAATLPFGEALAVADSALRDGLLGREDLIEAAAERRSRGVAQVRRVAAAADGDAANPFESALRAIVLDAGLLDFRPQQRVRLTTGTVVHVDLGDPGRRIALEADSHAHHASRQALRDDCRRYDELLRVGWLVLRFAWEHVLLDPGWVADVVREVCETWPLRTMAAGDRTAG